MQIVGFSVVVIFFALMQQAHAWDLDLPIPSLLTAVESNLRMPLPFFYLAIAPILLSLFLSFLSSQPFPSFASFTIISLICYLLANGLVIILILISQLVFYATAVVNIFIKTRLAGSLSLFYTCKHVFGTVWLSIRTMDVFKPILMNNILTSKMVSRYSFVS